MHMYIHDHKISYSNISATPQTGVSVSGKLQRDNFVIYHMSVQTTYMDCLEICQNTKLISIRFLCIEEILQIKYMIVIQKVHMW